MCKAQPDECETVVVLFFNKAAVQTHTRTHTFAFHKGHVSDAALD